MYNSAHSEALSTRLRQVYIAWYPAFVRVIYIIKSVCTHILLKVHLFYFAFGSHIQRWLCFSFSTYILLLLFDILLHVHMLKKSPYNGVRVFSTHYIVFCVRVYWCAFWPFAYSSYLFLWCFLKCPHSCACCSVLMLHCFSLYFLLKGSWNTFLTTVIIERPH